MDEQQKKLEKDYSISSVAIHGDNKKLPRNLEDRLSKGRYRAVFMTPEMANDRERFPKLWNMDGWRSRLLAIVIDEAHCIHSWGSSFRKAYSQIGNLRAKAPPGVPFIAMSATLPPDVLQTVKTTLYFRNDVTIVKADCDRPNIKYDVRQLPTKKDCILDLGQRYIDFAKTIIYFDDIAEMKKVYRYLHKEFSDKRRMIVRYFSDLSTGAKIKRMRMFKEGKIRVLLSTEAAGMGCDIPDIARVIQFRCPENISTLTQRLGRAARSPNLQGHGILYTVPSKNRYQKQDRHLDAFITTTECRRQVLNSAFGNPPNPLENKECCDVCDKVKGSSATGSSPVLFTAANKPIRWKSMSTSATRSNVHHTKEQQQEAEKRILEWRSDELTRGRAESEIYSSDSIMNMKTVAKLAAKFGSVLCHGTVSFIFDGRWQESNPGGQHRLEQILINFNQDISNPEAVKSKKKQQVSSQQPEEHLSNHSQDQQQDLSQERLCHRSPQRNEPGEGSSSQPLSPPQQISRKRPKKYDMKFVFYSPSKRGRKKK
jgi:superfamily II DNA helicase RecQ